MRTKRSSANEVDPSDTTDFAAKPPMGTVIALLSGFHLLCCGIPLMVASGVSLSSLLPSSTAVGALIAMAASVWFIWYLRRGCGTCAQAADEAVPSPHDRQIDRAPAQRVAAAGAEA